MSDMIRGPNFKDLDCLRRRIAESVGETDMRPILMEIVEWLSLLDALCHQDPLSTLDRETLTLMRPLG